MVNLSKLPESLLMGKHLHCQPIDDGDVVQADILPFEGFANTNKLIFCPERRSASRCNLKDDMCWYWRTCYIVGPGADRKE